MALIKCKECGKDISDTASKCVHCGYPLKEKQIPKQNRNKTKVSNILIWIVAVMPLLSTILLWIVWYLTTSWVVGMLVMLVVINVISVFLLLRDYKSLNDNGINTDPFDKISAFKIAIPKYLHNRAKILGDNLSYFITWIACFVVFAIVIIFGLNPLYLINNSINFVKRGTLYACPDYTVEELVNNYMKNPKWEMGTTVEGDKAVNIKGTVTYDDKPAKVVIQYFINGDEFEYNAFEMDGVAQGEYLYNQLITDMCQSMKDKNKDKNIVNSNDNKINDTSNTDDASKYIHEIDLNQFNKKLNSNFKSIVYLGDNYCGYCIKLESEFEKILPKYKLNLYYLNISTINKATWNSIIDFDISGFPVMMVIQDGKVLDYQLGYIEEDKIIAFFTKNGFISEE